MNLLFTICARAGSKGVKNKNTRNFCGKPLAYYTISVFELFKKKFDSEYKQIQLAVNTDSEALIEQLDKAQIEYIYIPRLVDLAGDVVAKISVTKDTLEKVEKQTGIIYDVIVDLDLTSPLRTVSDIRGTIEAVVRDKNAEIAYSVTDSRRSPYFNVVSQNEDGYYNTVLPSKFVSRQEVPKCYDMNASIYAYKREYLISGRIGERKAAVWKMQDTAVLDIDSEEDLELLEVLSQYFWNKSKELCAIKENIYEIEERGK